MIDNRKEIKVFKIRESINLPFKSNPNKIANCDVGDLLVCFDNKNVYAKDWNDTEEESFVLILNDLSFIEANERLFQSL